MTTRGSHRRTWSLCAGTLLLLAAGCQTTGQSDAGPARNPATEEATKGTERAILDVVAYYSTPIRWRWNQDRTRVHGLIVSALYLMGPGGKGVFGDGDIHPKLLVRDPAIPDPEKQWTLIKEWRFTAQDMYPMRSRAPTIQGYGYLLPLDWGDLDLSNRQIRVIIGYHRTDGMPDPRSSVKDLLVPAKGS